MLNYLIVTSAIAWADWFDGSDATIDNWYTLALSPNTFKYASFDIVDFCIIDFKYESIDQLITDTEYVKLYKLVNKSSGIKNNF